MKKDGIVILELITILIVVVMASGCTTTPKETVVAELDIGGSGITTKYVNVPSDAKIRVEISNVTTQDNPYLTPSPMIALYGLTIEGQDNQPAGNYGDNIVDSKTFYDLKNGYSGNNTLKSGLKSIAIVPNDVKAHIKIIAIT